MSKFHYKTYLRALEETNTLALDNQYLMDFAIPDPEQKQPYDALGILRLKDVRAKLEDIPQDTKNKLHLYYNVKKDTLMGTALKRETLHNISSKYHKMIETIHSKLHTKAGKIFIYHNLIHTSGTLFIREVLLNNGIIGEFDSSLDNTLCAVCGNPRKQHSKEQLMPSSITAGGGDLNIIIDQNKNTYTASLGDRQLFTYYAYENKYILLSRCFDYLDDPARDQATMPTILNYLRSIPVVIEISLDDQHIDLFKEFDHRVIGAYMYFYKKENFPEMPSWTAYIGAIKKSIAKRGGAAIKGHIYYPARFVIIHSNIDRKQITRSLEKFNHINNIDGSKFLILLGSKIIKESHSMNSTRNIMIMSRPDNISTMIQIIGRAVRLGSHKLLPREERAVDIQVYTSSIPKDKNKLSYEETKYKEKVETFKIIQKIERVMHRNAIDVNFNYESIWRDSKEDQGFGLGILPYKPPNIKMEFKLHELNLSTFNAFHAKFEVNFVMYIIKRLFIEISPAWTYADLLKATKAPPFAVAINTSIISQELFNIALNNLLFNISLNYTEPEIQEMNDKLTQLNIIDKLRDPDDKIILESEDGKYMITHVGEYYMLLPAVNDEMLVDIEILNRNMEERKAHTLNLTEYLRYDINHNYKDKKQRFIKKWENVSIIHLELALCDFGVKFHQSLMEEIIEYIFEVWTNPDTVKSEYHNFYLKMLYYYDLQRLIAWAHTLNKTLTKKYEKYVLPVTTKLLDRSLLPKDKKIEEESSGFVNLLISSLNKTAANWVSTGMVKDYENKLEATNALFDGIYKKKIKPKKINADMLPVGHFFTKIPRFYIPEVGGWRDDPTYNQADLTFKENPLIIGYDERSKTGISIKFKIRNPIQNIKRHKDSRMIERGSVCSTKSKNYLRELAKKLDIDTKSKSINVEDLCSKIRSKLIYYELKARTSGEKLRYFYFVYENQSA
jgi:sulfur carrier protein ThiS